MYSRVHEEFVWMGPWSNCASVCPWRTTCPWRNYTNDCVGFDHFHVREVMVHLHVHQGSPYPRDDASTDFWSVSIFTCGQRIAAFTCQWRAVGCTCHWRTATSSCHWKTIVLPGPSSTAVQYLHATERPMCSHATEGSLYPPALGRAF